MKITAYNEQIKILTEEKRQIGDKIIKIEEEEELRTQENIHLRKDLSELQRIVE